MIRTTKNKTIKYFKTIISLPINIFVSIFSTIIGFILALILTVSIFLIIGLVIAYNILEPSTMNTIIYDSVNNIKILETDSIIPIIENVTYVLTESTTIIDQFQDILIQYYESNDQKIRNTIEKII